MHNQNRIIETFQMGAEGMARGADRVHSLHRRLHYHDYRPEDILNRSGYRRTLQYSSLQYPGYGILENQYSTRPYSILQYLGQPRDPVYSKETFLIIFLPWATKKFLTTLLPVSSCISLSCTYLHSRPPNSPFIAHYPIDFCSVIGSNLFALNF